MEDTDTKAAQTEDSPASKRPLTWVLAVVAGVSGAVAGVDVFTGFPIWDSVPFGDSARGVVSGTFGASAAVLFMHARTRRHLSDPSPDTGGALGVRLATGVRGVLLGATGWIAAGVLVFLLGVRTPSELVGGSIAILLGTGLVAFANCLRHQVVVIGNDGVRLETSRYALLIPWEAISEVRLISAGSHPLVAIEPRSHADLHEYLCAPESGSPEDAQRALEARAKASQKAHGAALVLPSGLPVHAVIVHRAIQRCIDDPVFRAPLPATDFVASRS